MVRLILILAIAFLSEFCNAQGVRAVKWRKDSILTWQDFTGQIDTAVHHAAFAATDIGYHYDQQNENGRMKYVFSTSSYFYKTKSWCKPEAQTITLLKHEQLHFDISEYFARQLLTALNALSDAQDPEPQIFASYRQIRSTKDKVQNLYDFSTSHGADLGKQQQWEQFINLLLESNLSLKEALDNPLISRP